MLCYAASHDASCHPASCCLMLRNGASCCVVLRRAASFRIVLRQGGHYVAYVRRQHKWWLCDDSAISEATEAEALAAQAYMLLYIRREPASDEHQTPKHPPLTTRKHRSNPVANNNNNKHAAPLHHGSNAKATSPPTQPLKPSRTRASEA